ncbi:hypothetical protein RCC30_07685 [Pseudomonas fluorescens]|nr:hypothetical protein RCC30_07685 [Pseudomonas fluorescens]
MADQKPFALKPIYFPALTTLDPSDGYDGGIPIRAVENDLQVVIPAWFEMKLTDRVDFFWNNEKDEVWSKTLEHESELDRDVVFTLAKNHVIDGDAIDVFYKVSGKNHPEEESKPRLKLLVKLTRPGEYDDIPGDDGHSDFNFTLDHYVVDQDFTQNDVVTMHIVPYRNLTPYDRIHARWGSQLVIYLVSPEQAADPVKNPIYITFDYHLIKAAGDGPAVDVAYLVVDRCGNYPDERAPWSARQSVLVDMNGDRLDSPLVLVKGQPTDRVDLDILGNDDVIVRVYTPAKDFAVNDEVLPTWIGTPHKVRKSSSDRNRRQCSSCPFSSTSSSPTKPCALSPRAVRRWDLFGAARVSPTAPRKTPVSALWAISADCSRLPSPRHRAGRCQSIRRGRR